MNKRTVKIRSLLSIEKTFVLENLKTDLDFLFEDGVVEFMNHKEAVINRYLLDLLTLYPELPIKSTYRINRYYTNGMFTTSSANKLFSVLLEDIIKLVLEPSGRLRELPNVYKKMFEIINAIYNDVAYGKIDYINSINIEDFLDIQMDDELLLSMKMVEKENTVTSVLNTYDVLDKVIRGKKELRMNPVAKGYISGMMKINQVKQILGSIGYRTELDSKIFKKPIASSFCLGIPDMYGMAIDSRAAVKALHLSTVAIQDSEWFARELQLVTMVIKSMTIGDCGSRDYVKWYVKPAMGEIKSDLGNMVGKRYLDPETNKELVIKKDDEHLIGKHILIRAAHKCKLKDKHSICSACFGELSYGVFEHTNLGHLCGTTMTVPISQSILSTKHLAASAVAHSIVLDTVAKRFLSIKDKYHYAINKSFNANKNKAKLIITQDQILGLKDLIRPSDVKKTEITRVSLIEHITITTEAKNGKLEYFPIIIKDSGRYGSFTHKFLEYVVEAGYTLDGQDRYVIDLAGWTSAQAIITLPQVEYNFLDLSKETKALLKTMPNYKDGSCKYTPELLVEELFSLVNSKLAVNLAVIEVIVYAFTVTSIINKNYNLGRNIENPGIADIRDLIKHRSLGAGYGHEYVVHKLLSPDSFQKEHRMNHLLDGLIKPNEVLMDRIGTVIPKI